MGDVGKFVASMICGRVQISHHDLNCVWRARNYGASAGGLIGASDPVDRLGGYCEGTHCLAESKIVEAGNVAG